MSSNLHQTQDIRAGVIESLVEYTGNPAVRDVGDSASLADCGIDSLAVLDFVTVLEEKFQIEFDETSFTSANFRSVGQIVEVIAHVRKAGAA